MEKNPITPEGHEKLREELHHLRSVERPRVIQMIATAREHGDLKENAEYHAARDKQSFIEGRVKDLENKLALAEVIDPTKLSGDRIAFGGGLFGFKSRSDIAGDLSIRAGYAFDRVLMFGKVGAAWAHYTFTETYPLTGSPDTGHGDYSGLLLGLGFEYAIDLHWSVKGEYDYINYGSKQIPMYTALGGYDYTPSISNSENIVKAAVNYRF